MHEHTNAADLQTDWQAWSRLLRTVAHPVRLQILETLSKGPLCVNDVNALVPISQPQLSQHMAALRKMAIVACHTNGPLRCYYISRPTLVLKLIQLCTEEHPIVEKQRATIVREAAQRKETGPLSP